MDAVAVVRSPQFLGKASDCASRSCVLAASRPDFVSFDPRSHFSSRWLKGCRSISVRKLGQRGFGDRRNSGIRASLSSPNSSESSSPIAPLQLESPIGQFLSQILISHPHLVPAAVDQQLDQLQTDREAEKNKEEPSPSGTDLVLYRRIAEVKAKERRRALEEILYALVVQKFMEADVSLVPTLSQSTDPSERVDQWPPEEEKIERLHSPDAYEMIKNHLALILGQRLGDSNSVAPISKLRVGQVYAASVMYGYFLKRVDQRFQLEKSMKSLPWGTDEEEDAIKQAMPDESRPSAQIGNSHPEASLGSSPSFSQGGFGHNVKPCRLRSYVMSFDSETLQRYATVRSKEAFSIIEKHTEALFGRPEIVITPQGTIDSSKDELIKISFAGLRRLILEAVTFGSFLWDVESYVDSRYHFVTN
ncbi:UV-B-induced protein At3g17800, chloroplastic-like [Phoenix dactylifera]|uniref:UV-B-induced protein At3g17800, chloroplastic-like n=1 Tax=Phoenix dactylifera TaxID=42345 RepID=A0A8B7CFT1_PHODC|nr:UV-B-induced protein At3g17800, chloroplastic-like [Phoenix dactylifera]XP_026663047.1 UV-B-induced protein At3g17800, chloroplastic-like [Phoenix dactylifera]